MAIPGFLPNAHFRTQVFSFSPTCQRRFWMIVSTFGFHLLKCNVSSTPDTTTTLAATTNGRKGLSAGLEPPSAKLQAGKAKNTQQEVLGKAERGVSLWELVGAMPHPLAPSLLHSTVSCTHGLTSTITITRPFSSHHHHLDHPSSHSIIVLK